MVQALRSRKFWKTQRQSLVLFAVQLAVCVVFAMLQSLVWWTAIGIAAINSYFVLLDAKAFGQRYFRHGVGGKGSDRLIWREVNSTVEEAKRAGKVLVAAANYHLAKAWALRHGVGPRQFRYIMKPHDLRGYNKVPVFVDTSFYTVYDAGKLELKQEMDLLEQAGRINIVHVSLRNN